MPFVVDLESGFNYLPCTDCQWSVNPLKCRAFSFILALLWEHYEIAVGKTSSEDNIQEAGHLGASRGVSRAITGLESDTPTSIMVSHLEDYASHLRSRSASPKWHLDPHTNVWVPLRFEQIGGHWWPWDTREPQFPKLSWANQCAGWIWKMNSNAFHENQQPELPPELPSR